MSIGRDKVSQDAKDDAREARRRAMNKGDIDPGMEEDIMSDFDNSDWGESSWGSSNSSGGSSDFGTDSGSSFGSFGGGGSGFGSGFGGGSAFGTFGSTPEPQKKDDVEDKFFAAVGKILKGFFTFFRSLFVSFRTFDSRRRVAFGRSLLYSSAGVSVGGVVLLLFGIRVGLSLLVGGLISLGVGVFSFMVFYDAARQESHSNNSGNGGSMDVFGYSDDLEDEDAWESTSVGSKDEERGNFVSDSWDDDDFLVGGEDEEDGDDDEDTSNSFLFGSYSDYQSYENESVDRDSVLDEVVEGGKYVTREYLFEQMMRVLPSVSPNYGADRQIDEDSDEFDYWNAILVDSGEILRTGSNEDIPYLIEATDKMFYTLLVVNRPKWVKLDAFLREVQSICQYKGEGEVDPNIKVIGAVRGTLMDIKVMKNASGLIYGIKDLYKTVSDEIRNPSNMLPVVLGLDQYGKVVWQDLKHINSMLITGMPRSGKTWLMESIVVQLTMFTSPDDLELYFIDPKADLSDYRAMTMPHVRNFVSEDMDIIRMLRHLIDVEAKKRKELIGGGSNDAWSTDVNLWDYKKKNPDARMPLIYVIIDEVVTLAERMDDDVRKEFQSMLLTIITQLPAVGIRVFLVPHKINDSIIKKTTTDMISTRISVQGSEEQVKSNLSVKSFEHPLVAIGDSAVRLGNDEPFYMHNAVIAKTNEESRELFKFLTKFWLKINPEWEKGSFYERVMKKQEINRAKQERKVVAEGYSRDEGRASTAGISKEDRDELLTGIHDDFESDTDARDDGKSKDISKTDFMSIWED